jgi:hypothetical protein
MVLTGLASCVAGGNFDSNAKQWRLFAGEQLMGLGRDASQQGMQILLGLLRT